MVVVGGGYCQQQGGGADCVTFAVDARGRESFAYVKLIPHAAVVVGADRAGG